MKKPLLLAAGFILTVFMMYSCEPKREALVCDGQPTGETSLIVYAIHGSDTMKNYVGHTNTAYVQYGDSTFPGTQPSAYDAFFNGDDGENQIHIPNLNCGSYYIYRTAYDSLTNTTYKGGKGITFYELFGEKPIYIPVN